MLHQFLISSLSSFARTDSQTHRQTQTDADKTIAALAARLAVIITEKDRQHVYK